MSNKKISELIQATQVNDVDEFALVQSGQTKRVSKQTLQESLAVESGTTVNHEKLGTIDNAQLSDYTTGNSATVGDSGSLQGNLNFETSSPLRGKQSLKYENNATASNSDNDWVLRTIDVPLAYRGRNHEFNFQYTNTYSSSSVRVVLLVPSQTDPLVDFVLSNSSSVSEFSAQLAIPAVDVTAQWGFQILSGETGASLLIDDVQVTPNIREVNETVFIEQPDSSVRLYGFNGYGSTADKIHRFSTLDQKVGSSITYVDSVTDGASFTIEEDGIYHMYATGNFNVAAGICGISKNASDLTQHIYQLSETERLAQQETESGGFRVSCSVTEYLQRGDVIRSHSCGQTTTSTNEHSFTITKMGTVNSFPAFKNQKVDIPNSHLRMNNLQAGTFGNSRVRWDDTVESSGNAITVDNSDGTRIYFSKEGIVNITAGWISSTQINGVIRKNGAAISLSDVDVAGSFGETTACTKVSPGDYISLTSANVTSNPSDANLTVNHIETSVAVAVNNIEPQYGDQDSSVRVGTANGYGSTNTNIRRFATQFESLGSAVVYADSSADGASFTIVEDGTYAVSYSENFTGSSIFGITADGDPSQNLINNINTDNSKVLALSQSGMSASGVNANCSWQGFLTAGTVVRPHSQGVSAATNAETLFAISKVANPSVIGINDRPVDAYQQKSNESYLYSPLTQGTTASSNTAVLIFGSVVESNGSSIDYSVDTSLGSRWTILENGFYSFTAMVRPQGGLITAFGLVKNAEGSELDTPPYSVPISKKLAVTYNEPAASPMMHISWTGDLKEGDVLTIHSEAADVFSTDANYSFVRAEKLGSLIRSIPLIDSTVDIPTSSLELREYTGNGSTNNKITEWDTINKIEGEAFSIDSSDGTFVTILKSGVLHISSSLGSNAGAADMAIYRNPTDFTSGLSTNGSAMQAQTITSTVSSTSSWSENMAWSGSVKAGDVFCIATDGTAGSIRQESFNLIHQETEVSVALSNVEPQFEDTNSMVKLFRANGHGSVGNKIPRFTTVEEYIGSAITYEDSIENGASFTVQEDGIYAASFTTTGSGATYVGLSKNAVDLTAAIQATASEPYVLSFDTTGSNGWSGTANWTGFLRTGDVIRPHTEGATQTNSGFTHFTIAKQALPSIAEVDVTPFADLNQQVYQATELVRSGPVNITATTTPPTKGSIITDNMYWRRDGQFMDIEFEYHHSSAGSDGSGDYLIEIPNNEEIDTTFYNLDGNGTENLVRVNSIGYGHMGNQNTVSSASVQGVYFTVFDSNHFRVMHEDAGASSNSVTYWRSGNFGLAGTNTYVSGKLRVPIKGWANYESEYSTVYAVEDNENVFSAKIEGSQNTSVDQEQVILSKSGDFIARSVHTPTTGRWDIEWVAGFFSEAPAVSITAEGNGHFANVLSTNAHKTTVQVQDHVGSNIDDDFYIVVQRQGADYKDLQRQIVQLKEFPKVNNQITQFLTVKDANGYGSTDTTVRRFNTVLSDLGHDLIQHDTSAANGSTFTALKECIVHINYQDNATGGVAAMGITLNSTQLSTDIRSINNDVIVAATEAAGIFPNPFQATDCSTTVKMYAGDILRCQTNLSQDTTTEAKVVITAQAQELKSVGNLAGGENVFSAQVGINSDIRNESLEGWIVSKTGTGSGTITFVPGLFSEPPNLTATVDATFNMATADVATVNFDNVTTTSADYTVTRNDGSAVNRRFTIVAHRQGADYRDPQEQIIQLENFPRVNRTLTQNVHYKEYAGVGSPDNKIPYFATEVDNSGSSIVLIGNDSTNGFTITATRECVVNASYSLPFTSATQHSLGWSLNTTQPSTDVRSLTNTAERVALNSIHDNGANSGNKNSESTVSIVLKTGDVLRPHFDGTSVGPTPAQANLKFTATAQELERVDNVEAAENIFSARLDTSAVVTRTSSEFIQSAAKGGAGLWNITWTPGLFTEAPTLQVTTDNNNSTANTDVVSATGATVRVYNTSGTPTDHPIFITAHRTGDDYKNIQDVVVALPESKVKYQTKYLTSDIVPAASPTDLNFNNLEIGKTYRLNMQIYFNANAVTDFSLNAIHNGNIISKIGDTQLNAGGSHFKASSVVIFIATATTITYTTAGSGSLKGNGTNEETFVQLEELPLHEQTSQWT